MKALLKNLLPHFIAVVIFIGLASAYFSPLYSDYSLKQNDVKQFQGMAKEIVDCRLQNDIDPLWTNSMFGGMPAYQISVEHSSNFLIIVDSILKLGLPRPIGILFMAMLGFYIFALCMRINPWLGILGAIAFGFSTINILYLAGGHMTKVNAIVYMAPALGGMLLAFRGKWLLGSIIFALFFGLNLTANHLQMTYYLVFLLTAVAIGEGIRLLIQKEFISLGKVIAALSIGTILAVLPSASNLMTTLEYSKHTTRGATDLTIKPKTPGNSQAQEGLNKNYILEYNFGPGEFLSILSPNAKGEKGDYLGNDEVAMENVDSQYSEQIAQMNRYWGGQSSSGGAFYFGALMLTFFVLGLILIKDNLKWSFLAMSILAILLASNDPGGINDFFINKFPLYNKFRDSKMILSLLQVMIPALGILFLDRLFKKSELIENKKVYLYVTGGVVFSVILLYVFPSLSGSFILAEEVKMFAQEAGKSQDPAQVTFLNGLKQALIDTRISLYKSDLARSIFLVILACGIVLAAVYAKVSNKILLGIAIALVAFDKNPVQVADFSILENEKSTIPNFNEKVNSLETKMLPSIHYKNIAIENIKSLAAFGVLNLNTNFRVLSFSNPFAETNTSYFHKSIGGYHGAKLKRYQELVDFYINDEMMKVRQEFINKEIVKRPEIMAQYKESKDPQAQMQIIEGFFQATNFDSVVLQKNFTPVLNMLNTKYFISGKGVKATSNPNANGAAWFVSAVKQVNNSNEEMKALGKNNLSNTAIVNKEFSKYLAPLNKFDSTATISLSKYGVNELAYTSNSTIPMNAVFSEIYYSDGWNCYIDGKKTDKIFRANYILRGAMIPAGKHSITWKFEPVSFKKASGYSMIGSLLLLLSLGLVVGKEYRSRIASKNATSEK
ncbi:MAG: hypothetical protein EBR35_01275 [Flavobacteriales bacterium]|nr:hypothetical protein [Flavobacteriales bacterium]